MGGLMQQLQALVAGGKKGKKNAVQQVVQQAAVPDDSKMLLNQFVTKKTGAQATKETVLYNTTEVEDSKPPKFVSEVILLNVDPEKAYKGKQMESKKKAEASAAAAALKQNGQLSKKGKPIAKQLAKKKKQKVKKEYTPEQLAERRVKYLERNAATIEKEERQVLPGPFRQGESVHRAQTMAWIKPLNPEKMPANVKSKITAMNQESKAKAEAAGRKHSMEDSSIYMRFADTKQEGLSLKKGNQVKFKLYTDNKGVGACEVMQA